MSRHWAAASLLASAVSAPESLGGNGIVTIRVSESPATLATIPTETGYSAMHFFSTFLDGVAASQGAEKSRTCPDSGKNRDKINRAKRVMSESARSSPTGGAYAVFPQPPCRPRLGARPSLFPTPSTKGLGKIWGTLWDVLGLCRWSFPQLRKESRSWLASKKGTAASASSSATAAENSASRSRRATKRAASLAVARLEDNLSRLEFGASPSPTGRPGDVSLVQRHLGNRPKKVADQVQTLGQLLDRFLESLTPGILAPAPGYSWLLNPMPLAIPAGWTAACVVMVESNDNDGLVVTADCRKLECTSLPLTPKAAGTFLIASRVGAARQQILGCTVFDSNRQRPTM